MALCSGHHTRSIELPDLGTGVLTGIPPLQSKTPHAHLLLPCPGPQQLGPELDPVILVVFPGPGHLLPPLRHLVLGPALAVRALLEFLLKGEQQLSDHQTANSCRQSFVSQGPLLRSPHPGSAVMVKVLVATDVAKSCHYRIEESAHNL